MLELELHIQLLIMIWTQWIVFYSSKILGRYLRRSINLFMDLWVSGQAPQFESLKPVKEVEDEEEKNRHFPTFPLRYLKVCVAACIWISVGDCKHWLNLPTT